MDPICLQREEEKGMVPSLWEQFDGFAREWNASHDGCILGMGVAPPTVSRCLVQFHFSLEKKLPRYDSWSFFLDIECDIPHGHLMRKL